MCVWAFKACRNQFFHVWVPEIRAPGLAAFSVCTILPALCSLVNTWSANEHCVWSGVFTKPN